MIQNWFVVAWFLEVFTGKKWWWCKKSLPNIVRFRCPITTRLRDPFHKPLPDHTLNYPVYVTGKPYLGCFCHQSSIEQTILTILLGLNEFIFFADSYLFYVESLRWIHAGVSDIYLIQQIVCIRSTITWFHANATTGPPGTSQPLVDQAMLPRVLTSMFFLSFFILY